MSFIIFFIVTMASGCSTVFLGLKKYESGDNSGAKPVLQKGCDENDRAACFILSAILNEEGNYKESLVYLEKSCELGNLRSCSRLGESYLRLDKIKEARTALEKSKNINLWSNLQMTYLLHAEKKYAEEKKILSDLCNNQSKLICSRLGDLADIENDFVMAKKLYMMADDYMDMSIELAEVEKKLGNNKQAGIKINEACGRDNGLACRIKKLATLEKGNSTFEKSYTSKCAELDGEACYNLGLHFLQKNNLVLSESLFEKACKLGNGDGCLERYNEDLFTSPHSELIKLLKESCEKGSGSGCEVLYTRYYNHEDITPLILDKGCSFGKGNACYLMANIYWENKNKVEALKMYDRACQRGLKQGCFYFDFSDKDENIQETTAEKYCSQKIEVACLELGKIYNRREKFPLALKYYQLSCDLKNQSSCSYVIELQGKIDKNFDKIKAYAKLCTHSSFKACGLAADLLEEAKQTEEAKKFYERGCYTDDSRSCDYLGWLYQSEKNYEKAIYYYRQGCDLGSSYGCDHFAMKL